MSFLCLGRDLQGEMILFLLYEGRIIKSENFMDGPQMPKFFREKVLFLGGVSYMQS